VNKTSIVADKKVYSSDNGFSCITVTENGNFAIGSNAGDIRLYNDVGKIAKNKFIGFGGIWNY